MTPDGIRDERLRYARCATCTQLAHAWYKASDPGDIGEALRDKGQSIIPAETPEASAAKVAYREHRKEHHENLSCL